MHDPENALKQLRHLVQMEEKLRREREDLWRSSFLSRDQIEDEDRLLESQLREREARTTTAFQHILLFPPSHFQRHAEALKEFFEQGSFDRSVFIMTKFPETNQSKRTELDTQLERVISAVRDGIRAADLIPRVASDHEYHELLWLNVELYLLGSARGIAVVEDRYRPEFNPNVAMEWGWMRAMRRPVLYLVEESFDNARADTAGYLSRAFPWHDPESVIPSEVKQWLSKD